MLQKLKKHSSLVLTIIFIGLFTYYLSVHKKDLSYITTLNPKVVLIVVLGHVAAIYTTSLFNQVAIRYLGKEISAVKSLNATIIGAIGNFFMPVGSGTSLKAAYLKKITGLSYSDFTAVLSANYIFVFLINSLFGLLSLFFLQVDNSVEGYLFLKVVFSLIIITMLSLIIVKTPRSRFIKRFEQNKYLQYVKKVLEGWRLIRKNYSLIFKLVLFIILNFLTVCLITWASFKSVGYNLSAEIVVLFAALNGLSILLNITPGSIGIREAIYLIVSAPFQLSTTIILAAALVDRIIRISLLALSWMLLKITDKPAKELLS